MLKPKTIQKNEFTSYDIIIPVGTPKLVVLNFLNTQISYVTLYFIFESVEPVQCFKIWSLCEWGFLTGITTRFTESFPSFVPNTHELYILSHCNNIVVILQKNRFNPVTFIFWIK